MPTRFRTAGIILNGRQIIASYGYKVVLVREMNRDFISSIGELYLRRIEA